MLKKIRTDYNHTLYASFIGYIVQAIVNNFAPLLFLTFQKCFSIGIDKIATLIAVNFGTQLLIDAFSAGFAVKIGYRRMVVSAHLCCGFGLIMMAWLPKLITPYAGLLIATVIYAVGGGIIEVMVSPLVEACPTKKKSAAMSMLHSFYSWGQAGVIALSALFFLLVGIERWSLLATAWALIPLINAGYFALVPMSTLEEVQTEKVGFLQLLKKKMFWIMVVMMICAGACELSIAQWASNFIEAGLGLPKLMGDLLGPCVFAVLMGVARILYAKLSERLKMLPFMLFCGILCLSGYMLLSLTDSAFLGLIGCAVCGFSVGIMWPGTYSIAAGKIRGGGTRLFALLALSGDLGCASGPALVGYISEHNGGNLRNGIFVGSAFPVLLILCTLICINMQRKARKYTKIA